MGAQRDAAAFLEKRGVSTPPGAKPSSLEEQRRLELEDPEFYNQRQRGPKNAAPMPDFDLKSEQLSDEWSCLHCTMINKSCIDDAFCEMCSLPRYGTFQTFESQGLDRRDSFITH